jgi:hypothetical protein
MRLDRIESMAQQYGPDTVLLIGGALQQEGPDLTAGVRTFLQAIRQLFPASRLAPPEIGPAAGLPGGRP